jgi:spore germination cell wall hydrolase CwlJ-like protein
MKNKSHKILLLGAILAGTLIPSEQAMSSLGRGLHSPTTIIRKNLDNLLESNMFGNSLPTLPEEKPDYKTDNFYKDTDEVLLARLLLGECENCSNAEKIAVAYTVINRMNDGKKWNGETLQEVILSPFQYSAFNENLNAKLKDPMSYNSQEFQSCLQLAKEILAGKHSDPTSGATHYLNPRHPDLWGKPLPKWTEELINIGRIQNSFHVFYKEI